MHKPLFVAFAAVLSATTAAPAAAQTPFRVDETTIADVHAAMRAGRLTCHALVQAYLDRIDAYDKKGPSLNAITVVNPEALATADSLDKRFAARKQLTGPLHCIPMIVKDHATIGLQTAVGNIVKAKPTLTRSRSRTGGRARSYWQSRIWPAWCSVLRR